MFQMMDPISQALLGVVAAQSICSQPQPKPQPKGQPQTQTQVQKTPSIWWVAALAAMSPDIDSFLAFSHDPIMYYHYHRHFTHSLFFIPIGSFLVTFFLWAGYKGRIDFFSYYKVVFVAFATHGLLDSLTAFGTVLFWPLSSMRVSLDALPVVDLLFTSSLFVGFLYTQWSKKRRGAILALVFALFLAGVGFYQNHKAHEKQVQLAQERGHEIEKYRILPTISNFFLWRSIYKYDGEMFSDAIYVLPFQGIEVQDGERKKLLPQETFKDVSGKLAKDIDIFYWFSDGWVIGNKNLIFDARYTTRTSKNLPLWGVRIKDGRLKSWQRVREKKEELKEHRLSDVFWTPWKKALGLL